MNALLTFCVLVSLVLAGQASIEAITAPQAAFGLSEQQFHDGCSSQHGRYSRLRGRVGCTLDVNEQIVCEFDRVLGNCLWTGPIRVASLAAVLGNGAAGVSTH